MGVAAAIMKSAWKGCQDASRNCLAGNGNGAPKLHQSEDFPKVKLLSEAEEPKSKWGEKGKGKGKGNNTPHPPRPFHALQPPPPPMAPTKGWGNMVEKEGVGTYWGRSRSQARDIDWM